MDWEFGGITVSSCCSKSLLASGRSNWGGCCADIRSRSFDYLDLVFVFHSSLKAQEPSFFIEGGWNHVAHIKFFGDDFPILFINLVLDLFGNDVFHFLYSCQRFLVSGWLISMVLLIATRRPHCQQWTSMARHASIRLSQGAAPFDEALGGAVHLPAFLVSDRLHPHDERHG